MGKNTREFNTTKVKGRDSKESHFFSLIRLIKTVNRDNCSVFWRVQLLLGMQA